MCHEKEPWEPAPEDGPPGSHCTCGGWWSAGYFKREPRKAPHTQGEVLLPLLSVSVERPASGGGALGTGTSRTPPPVSQGPPQASRMPGPWLLSCPARVACRVCPPPPQPPVPRPFSLPKSKSPSPLFPPLPKMSYACLPTLPHRLWNFPGTCEFPMHMYCSFTFSR